MWARTSLVDFAYKSLRIERGCADQTCHLVCLGPLSIMPQLAKGACAAASNSQSVKLTETERAGLDKLQENVTLAQEFLLAATYDQPRLVV